VLGDTRETARETGYSTVMSEQTAPDLGPPTNAEDVDEQLDVDGDEKTIETPDELGGTGGEQSGGAG
jgi:hypothetical protein